MTTGNGNHIVNLLKLAGMKKNREYSSGDYILAGFSRLEPLCEGGQRRRRRNHCVAAAVATVAIRSPARPK